MQRRNWFLVIFALVGVLGLAAYLNGLARADDKEPEVPAGVKALIDALKDTDADVRKTAAQSLGRIGGDQSGQLCRD